MSMACMHIYTARVNNQTRHQPWLTMHGETRKKATWASPDLLFVLFWFNLGASPPSQTSFTVQKSNTFALTCALSLNPTLFPHHKLALTRVDVGMMRACIPVFFTSPLHLICIKLWVLSTVLLLDCLWDFHRLLNLFF